MSGWTTVTQKDPFVTSSANTTGSFSEILEVQTPQGKQFTYPPNRAIELFVLTHEQFTSSGTTQENYDLSNTLVDSPSLNGDGGSNGVDTSPPGGGQADVVLFEEGQGQNAPDEVRYDTASSNANRVSYTPNSADNNINIYYVWGDSGLFQFRHYKANEEGYDVVGSTTPGETHTVRTYSNEDMITFSNSFTVKPKERLKVMLNSSVDVTNWDAFSGGGPNSSTSFSSFRFPARVEDAPRQRRANPRSNRR